MCNLTKAPKLTTGRTRKMMLTKEPTTARKARTTSTKPTGAQICSLLERERFSLYRSLSLSLSTEFELNLFFSWLYIKGIIVIGSVYISRVGFRSYKTVKVNLLASNNSIVHLLKKFPFYYLKAPIFYLFICICIYMRTGYLLEKNCRWTYETYTWVHLFADQFTISDLGCSTFRIHLGGVPLLQEVLF